MIERLMDTALPGPGLWPDPVRLSCGCRDQHKGERLWRKSQSNWATGCASLRIVSTESSRTTLWFMGCGSTSRSPCWECWRLRRPIVPLLREWLLGLSNGLNCWRAKTATVIGDVSRSCDPILSIQADLICRSDAAHGPGRYRFTDDLAHPRFLVGRERRQSAALRRQGRVALSKRHRSNGFC